MYSAPWFYQNTLRHIQALGISNEVASHAGWCGLCEKLFLSCECIAVYNSY